MSGSPISSKDRYDPKERTQCPKCPMVVGLRNWKRNQHFYDGEACMGSGETVDPSAVWKV